MKHQINSQNPTIYDIIVVYNHFTAFSAADNEYDGKKPFCKNSSSSSCNRSYRYLLRQCEKYGLNAAFATTDDIAGPGLFSSVWIFNNSWKRKTGPAYTRLIFDKFSPLAAQYSAQHDLLTANPGEVKFFHSKKIRSLFDNKLRTYKYFPNHAVPTVKINMNTEKSIESAQKKLQHLIRHSKNPHDFSDTFVLKDKYGFAGINVYKVSNKNEIERIYKKKKKRISFVLQPYIDASGFLIDDHHGNIDLRVIVSNGKIVQCYIRIAKPGDFRANASQGGEIAYLSPEKIPNDIIKMSQEIEDLLPVKKSFYSLDYIKSKAGNLYLIEGNTTPGLNWFNEEDEMHAKQLMRLIVQQSKRIADSLSKQPAYTT